MSPGLDGDGGRPAAGWAVRAVRDLRRVPVPAAAPSRMPRCAPSIPRWPPGRPGWRPGSGWSGWSPMASGRRVVEAVGVGPDGPVTVHGRRFVVSAGAANSAALLLASTSAEHPDGLGNSSGRLGRSFMMHNNAHIAAVDVNRHNDVVFQKTVMVTDWYHDGGDGHPLGTVQTIGKVQGADDEELGDPGAAAAARRDRAPVGRVGGHGRGPARPREPGHAVARADGSAPPGSPPTPASTPGCSPGPSG